ncbi:hypothetical protein OAB85_03610 [Pseudomonadales bacterium]|nr:hypothetical protein [Pseudomonadales bacterium]|tara:strand:+ start:914 stop:1261 length:348 start_codon:yes stop_codon:yes gene_type:complete
MKKPNENPFGRLTLESYFQQFAISCTFPALAPVTFRQGYQQPTLSLPLMAFTALSALFYPSSRFAYDSLCGFVSGQSKISGSIVFEFYVQTFHCDIMFFARKISSAHWFYLPKLF